MQDPTYTQSESLKGLNLDNQISKLDQGTVTYALNSILSSYDGNYLSYQNEGGNSFCSYIPDGYDVVGVHAIPEDKQTVLWLYSATKATKQIAILDNEACTITSLVTAACFSFDMLHPVLKAVHRKTNNSTEVYWVNKGGRPSYIDLKNLPYATINDGCNNIPTTDVDCNKTYIQPDFAIPRLDITAIREDGALVAGEYQFAIQYADSIGEALTSVYSVSNGVPIADENIVSANYNYNVSKSIEVAISNLDTTGVYNYFNLLVIQTVNAISTVYLIGTYSITSNNTSILYSGVNKQLIQEDILDIFVKFPTYDVAEDITTAQDILILGQVTETERISFQSIANQIHLKWGTVELNMGDYADPLITNKYTGYLRNEVYGFEFVPLYKNGKQGDGFHIPARVSKPYDIEVIDVGNDSPNPSQTMYPRWQIYNTAYADAAPSTTNPLVVQTGEFSYWESTSLYPCDAIWGSLANQPIRHHKFPDNSVSPYIATDNVPTSPTYGQSKIMALGVVVDNAAIQALIQSSTLTASQKAAIVGFKIVRTNRAGNKSIIAKGTLTNVLKYTQDSETYLAPNYLFNDVATKDPYFKTVVNEETQTRYTFHSPNTSFVQPSLGTRLQIDGELYGKADINFSTVSGHSQYHEDGYFTNPDTGEQVKANKLFNFGTSVNGVGTYNSFVNYSSNGNSLRNLTLKRYLQPGMVGGDDYTINNFERESSVYLKTNLSLPYIIANGDNSKQLPEVELTPGQFPPEPKIFDRSIATYYGEIKNELPNQYGNIYSYETIDTGYQYLFNVASYTPNVDNLCFGGDTFINMFAYKSKLPVFVQNMVGKPDNADVFYSKLGNLGDPIYYMDIAGYDSNKNTYAYQYLKLMVYWTPFGFGYPYLNNLPLFLYGINNFPVESEVNVDLRQATNDTDGDFYPHVGTNIPNDWLQEINTPIAKDNTYNYNVSYSKQNKENNFSHIPNGYDFNIDNNVFPYRCIFSDPQQTTSSPLARNNWKIFKPASYFDFPQNCGRLISLDGVENKQVYARFENKTLIYNALLTAPSTTEAIYLGQTLFNSAVPPLDLADTDMGYMGTQSKFFLKIEYGYIMVDTQRGNIFLLERSMYSYGGRAPKDLGKQGISKFLKKYLGFFISRYFPNVDVDNPYNGIGLTGIYDASYDRLILTKLDYEPIKAGIVYDGTQFTYQGLPIQLTDQTYFKNRSFTISFSFEANCWIGFHSYLPNYYIGDTDDFKSGNQTSIWNHNAENIFNTFYGEIAPYVLEVPRAYQFNDELLQSIIDYSKVDTFVDLDNNYTQVDDGYFNKMILYNDQQTSGLLLLTPKPKRNMYATQQYPVYNIDSKEVIFTKTDNLYKINTFWSVTKDNKQPLWLPSTKSLSEWKILNQDNCNYKKLAHNKIPLRAKDLRVRYILDNRSDIRITSKFTIHESEKSIL